MTHLLFPPYLAYGKLNEQSIHSDHGFQVAHYDLLGERVMKVKQAPGKTELIEIFRGKSYSHTFNKELKQGFLNHFMLCDPLANPVMSFLVNQVCALGNIYFQFFDTNNYKSRVVYYPAAYLCIIRIPVTDDNVAAILETMKDTYLYNLETDLYPTQLLIDKKDGSTETKDILLLELISPIAFLYETMQWLAEKKLLLKEKIYRTIIQDALQKHYSKGCVFAGTKNDDWEYYSILFNLKTDVQNKTK